MLAGSVDRSAHRDQWCDEINLGSAEVFADPLALTVFDEGHSVNEERWFTLGTTRSGRLLAVAHTFVQTSATQAAVRIISGREATRRKRKDYEKAPR